MTKTRSAALVALCAAVAVAAAVFLFWRQRPTHRSSPPFSLYERLRAEATLPGAATLAKLGKGATLASVADADSEFRQWLLGEIVSQREPRRLRGEAFNVMYQMQNGGAVREMVQYLLPRLDEATAATREERFFRRELRGHMVLIALLADWPVPETLEFVQTALPEPHGWRGILEAQVAHDPSGPSARPPERQQRLTERAKQVLEYADSQQSSKGATE